MSPPVSSRQDGREKREIAPGGLGPNAKRERIENVTEPRLIRLKAQGRAKHKIRLKANHKASLTGTGKTTPHKQRRRT